MKIPLHKRIHEEAEKNGCKIYAVENVSDHIHMALECPSKISISNLVQNLKTTSTHLIKSFDKQRNFNWQEGYGVFSVGKPALEKVIDYVLNQEKHHNVQSFQDEWKTLKGMINMN